MSDTMRGLFFVMKGQYRKKEGVSYTNTISGEVMHLGGYNPSFPTTPQWYQVMDRNTFHTVACGSSLQQCMESLKNCIIRHKGDAKRFYRYVSNVTSEDYYETHYLGNPPLSPEERVKKAEGRCPRTSPLMKDLYSQVLTLYGDYFSDQVECAEEEAYKYLKENTDVSKSRKVLNKIRKDMKVTQQDVPDSILPRKKHLTPSPTLKPGLLSIPILTRPSF